MRLVGASFDKDSMEKFKDRRKAVAVWTDMENCGGCRACEVACSFHHTDQCSPARSSIQIRLNPSDGSLIVSIMDSCDLCENEKDGPLCVQACAHGALEVERLFKAVKSE